MRINSWVTNRGENKMISENTARFLKRVLPKPVLRNVTRIILDGYLSKYARIEVVNGERIEGVKDPVIFACNHLSNSDALVLHKVLKNNDITFVAGVKLSQNPVTSLGLELVKIVPINPNTADKAAIENTVRILKQGRSILIFPEGTRSRAGSMIKVHKGVLLLAKLTGLPIVPIGICGTEKLLPINDNDMGGESFRHADVKVAIGESFNIPAKCEGEDRHSYEDRAICYIAKQIANLLPEEYRGIYH